MIYLMEKVYLKINKGIYIKDAFKMELKREISLRNQFMILFLLECIKIIRKQAKENIHVEIDLFMKEIFKMIKLLVKECGHGLTALNI